MTGSATIIRANARSLPLPDNSVDLICTSPPYFALRSYQDGGEHYAGQLGSEPTPAEFVDSLLEVTRECMRVLKPSGSLWVNLGDKYASNTASVSNNGTGASGLTGGIPIRDRETAGVGRRITSGVPTESLIGIPWRYALRCIDDLGLILRAEVIWSKPNGLPESVTDRVRRSHEQWFHFVQQPRYFSAVDEIREAQDFPNHSQLGKDARGQKWIDTPGGSANAIAHHDRPAVRALNPLGKLPGSVWTIDERESLTRTVLSAVSHGKLTVDEGERILWSTPQSSGAGWTAPPSAGPGQDYSTGTDTGATTPSASEPDEHTGSPTSSLSDQSLTDSLSTTSAGTPRASDLTTLRQSPSRSTSTDAHGPQSAHRDMPTTSGTRTSDPTAGESAEHACVTGCVPHEHVNGPPSVWQIATQPLTVPAYLGVDHFAAFPMEWPRRIIKGWAPTRGVCSACGEGRRPMTLVDLGVKERNTPAYGAGNHGTGGSSLGSRGTSAVITGYACACPEPTAPTTPGTVLDPFGGTGTTALLAKVLGCHGISVDMSADYCRLAEWRTNDPSEIARAMQVDKPAEQVAGQADLFDLIREASA